VQLTTSATQLTMEHNILANLNFKDLLAQLTLRKQALDDLIDGEELSQPLPEPIFVVSGKHSAQSPILANNTLTQCSVDGDCQSKMVKNVGLNRLKIENGFKHKKLKSLKEPILSQERIKERQPTADSSDLSEGAAAQHTNDEIFKCEYCTKVFHSSQQLGGHVSRGHPGKSVAY
jgi:hypothetical protein